MRVGRGKRVTIATGLVAVMVILVPILWFWQDITSLYHLGRLSFDETIRARSTSILGAYGPVFLNPHIPCGHSPRGGKGPKRPRLQSHIVVIHAKRKISEET